MSSTGGWFEDPTGRFAQRFFDGATWSEQVVGANGSVFVDVLPPGATIDPPPGTGPDISKTDETPETDEVPDELATTDIAAGPPRPRAAAADAAILPATVNRPVRYVRPDRRRAGGPETTPDRQEAAIVTAELPVVDEQPYVPPRPDGPPAHQSQSAGSGRPDADPGNAARLDQLLPGLVVAVLGVICVLLSLLALDWASSGDTTFFDIGRHVSAGDDALVHAYTAWLAWVLLVLTIAAVVLAGRPAPRWRSASNVPRIAGSALAGVAALLQTIVITHVFRGAPSPQFGAWLGVAGYLVVIGGMTLGTSRRG